MSHPMNFCLTKSNKRIFSVARGNCTSIAMMTNTLHDIGFSMDILKDNIT